MTLLRFTIGPVQDFVRQSRRTRDLWAGSFLLSYLSGCALHGAAKANPNNTIVLPQVDDDDLYKFIAGQGEKPPLVGSLPNRFEIQTDEPELAAQAAKEALERAWQRICCAVWNEYIAPIAQSGRNTETIFQRQVQSFWEIQWVAAENDEQLKGLLERRKNWRNRMPTTEPGDKCLVMPQFQELSGYHRARESTQQDAFWQQLKQHNRLRDFELRPGERLCALALVKRLYPRTKSLFGWALEDVRNWRSTVYVAAIPWIDEVLQAKGNDAHAYATHICEIDREAEREKPHPKMLHTATSPTFAALDANYFHVPALENPEATFTDEDIKDRGNKRRPDLIRELQQLYGKDEPSPLGPPASFYALLLMDGDRVGSLLADPKVGGTGVSNALAEFTKNVRGIVDEHCGSTVYAGGDDVLAMVPVNSVLACAWELRHAYQKAFKGHSNATISVGIVLAHIRRPLLEVLDEAHRLLDDVAKDGNGRDSVAIALLRSGDRALQWASTWDDEHGQSRLGAITGLRDRWREKSNRTRAGDKTPIIEGEISSGVVYRLRETMGLLCGWPRWSPGECRTFAAGDPKLFFAAEIRRILRAQGLEGDTDKAERDEAVRLAEQMLDVVHPVQRVGSPPQIQRDKQRIGMDGLLLALFLATDGKERDHGVMEARS